MIKFLKLLSRSIWVKIRTTKTRMRGVYRGLAEVFPNAPADAQDVLAMTLWGECRSESDEGRRAVASVIYNRAQWNGNLNLFMRGITPLEAPTLRGRIKAVCLAKSQFSCWKWKIFTQESPYACNQWTDCIMLSKVVLGGCWSPTVSSVYYHADYIKAPSWTKDLEVECKIGKHIFYKISKV
jgi:spore germination cell wall hydrolase CwlJ-like protein